MNGSSVIPELMWSITQGRSQTVQRPTLIHVGL